MAAGSSAPELFTSLAGATKGSDVGVGTIVGSAVFNLLVIVALSAALAGQILNLDWRPLTRDSCFYALSIASKDMIRRPLSLITATFDKNSYYFYDSFRWFFMGWIYNMVGSFDFTVAILLLRRSDEIQSSIDGLFIEN